MTHFTRTAYSVLFLLSAMSSFPVNAALHPGVRPAQSATLSQSYSWYDGVTTRQVWLNPELVADFKPSSRSARAVRTLSSSALQLKTRTGARIWQLKGGDATAARSLAEAYPSGRFSPVFHENADGSGRLRALPGNVIVCLNPAWDVATVGSWIKTHQLEVVRKLEIGANTFLIKTSAGLDALNVANKLYQSGEVVSASPDWWQEVSTR